MRVRSICTACAVLYMIMQIGSNSIAEPVSGSDIYKKTVPSVVTIQVTGHDFSAIGTGFAAIKDGIYVTAWHVVKGAQAVSVKFSNGEEFESSGLIDKDEKRDIALIRVKAFGKPLVALTPNDPEIGTKAYVIGAPKGLDFTLSDGLISRLDTTDGITQYQFSCPVTHGNSGGPLLNADGEALGVVVSGLEGQGDLSFAIPAKYVLGLDSTLPTQPWDAVKSSRPAATTVNNDALDRTLAQAWLCIADHIAMQPYLDKTVWERRGGYKSGTPICIYAEQKQARQLCLKLLDMASDDTDRESIRTGYLETLKEIIAVDTEMIDQISHSVYLEEWAYGAKDAANNSKAATVGLTSLSSASVKKVQTSNAFLSTFTDDQKYILNFVSDPLTINIGMNVLPSDPLFVIDVMDSSPADRMGFKRGDHIVNINGHPVTGYEDFKEQVKANAGHKVQGSVLRDGKERTLELNIPAASQL